MSKKVKRKSRKYTQRERRAFWTGFGFHAGESLGMNSQQIYSLLGSRERSSFVAGRAKADNLSSKFVPDYLADGGRRRSRRH